MEKFNLTKEKKVQNIEDCFIQKLDVNGNFIWVKQLSGGLHINITSIDVDIYENVYLTGSFRGNIKYIQDNKIVSYWTNGNNGSDIFLAKIDENYGVED